MRYYSHLKHPRQTYSIMTSINTPTNIRLDTWLWTARLYKTRSLAQSAINGGKVKVNNTSCKPSKTIKIGDTIQCRTGWDNRTVLVLGIIDKRQSAALAQTLYQETPDSLHKRMKNSLDRQLNNKLISRPQEKPNKKDRRNLRRLKSDF